MHAKGCPSIDATDMTTSIARVAEGCYRSKRIATKSLVLVTQMLSLSETHLALVWTTEQHEGSGQAVTNKATAVVTTASSTRE